MLRKGKKMESHKCSIQTSKGRKSVQDKNRNKEEWQRINE